ncbi:MAG: GvpL/GvpF family gas vesicle protein [Syntrophobacteraceae bacterium]
MSLLLYCILRGRTGREHPCLTGVNGEKVLFVTAEGLCAAVSRVNPSELALDAARILAYEKVVARLHREFTVIPMRYGCVLDGESRIARLLEERRGPYAALLDELAGRVEMGVRVLSADRGCDPERRAVPRPHPNSPGRDYLAAQRSHYARDERRAEAGRAFVKRVRAAFAGLFVKWKEESRTAGIGPFALPAPLFSLYFLIPAESVEEFRKRFHELDTEDGPGLLLTGPWAPYSFVISDEA